MIKAMALLRTLFNDRRGVTAVEYAVVAAGIIAVAATSYKALGLRLQNMINNVLP